MSISIEWREHPDGDWRFNGGYYTVDAAKTACRNFRKNGSSYRNLDFRIYHNDRCFLVSALNSGWRLRWIPGNGLTREEQVG